MLSVQTQFLLDQQKRQQVENQTTLKTNPDILPEIFHRKHSTRHQPTFLRVFKSKVVYS